MEDQAGADQDPYLLPPQADQLAGIGQSTLLQRRSGVRLSGATAAPFSVADPGVRAAFEAMGSGVMVLDAAETIIYANEAGRTILGLDRLRGSSGSGRRWRVRRPDGSAWPAAELPSRIALRTGLPQREALMSVAVPALGRRWLLVDAVQVSDTGGARQVVITFRDVTEQRQADEAMAEVGAALASALDPSSIYDVILGQAARVLPFDRADIVLYRDGWAVSVASAGEPSVPPGTPLVPINTTTSTWRSMSAGRVAYLPDTTDLPGWQDRPPWVGPYRIRSSIRVPLVVEGGLLGSFGVASFTPHFYTAEQIRTAAAFGERARLAVRNSRLFAAERERARIAEELARLRQEHAEEAEALGAVSAALAGTLEPAQLYQVILEQSARILPCDHAGVTLYEGGWATFYATWGEPRIAPGFRYSMPDLWLPDTVGSVAYLPDADAEPGWLAVPPLVGPYRARSVLSAPLTSDGAVVGSFWVSSRTPGFYGERHRRLAAVFADRATQALRNARLYEVEQRRRRAAEELASLQRDFAASVSHELRTPLTAIVGYGELLEARWQLFTEEQRRHRIAQIVLAANRQRRLVEDLLLVGRLEGGGLAPDCRTLRLAPLVEQAVGEVRGSYAGQLVTLCGPADLQVYADGARTTQVLANLLDNAAKYSPEGSPIEVRWEREGEAVAVRVRDYGPGVPEEGRERLFTRFGRLAGSAMRAGRVGTGLGLYLSRGLAEAMGGCLDLETTGPRGSTFRLRLPAAGDARLEES